MVRHLLVASLAGALGACGLAPAADLRLFQTGFDKLSSLVSTLRSIMHEMKNFLLLMSTVIFLTSLALTLQLSHIDPAYDSLSTGTLTAYQLMLGNFGSVDYSASSQVLTYLLLFTLLVNIVLLNTLIAIISERFEKELEKARESAALERALLVLEIEELHLSDAQRRRADWFPAWLHALKRAGAGERSSDEWSGRVKAIKNDIHAKAEATQRAVAAEAKAIEKKLSAKLSAMQGEMSAMQGEILKDVKEEMRKQMSKQMTELVEMVGSTSTSKVTMGRASSASSTR